MRVPTFDDKSSRSGFPAAFSSKSFNVVEGCSEKAAGEHRGTSHRTKLVLYSTNLDARTQNERFSIESQRYSTVVIGSNTLAPTKLFNRVQISCHWPRGYVRKNVRKERRHQFSIHRLVGSLSRLFVLHFLLGFREQFGLSPL